MMKKNILTQITFLLSFYTFGQVGIGTTNPQGILHIDAATNTVLGTTSTHTDDFIITSTGNVGIGTLAPSTKLEINSSTAGSIKIVDGTQGEGKVLVSDATGIGTWQELPVFKYVTSGNFNISSGDINSDTSTTSVKYSQASIVLSKGKWMINTGLTIMLRTVNATTNLNPYWLSLYLSSSPTTVSNTNFTYVGNVAKNFGGNMIKNQTANNPNFITGSTIIDVQANNTTIYLLIQNLSTDSNNNAVDWKFSPSNYENYLNAVPAN